ncbi:MAG: tetratricopeptide repeat protein, partial [Bacteroidales bacterium]|nr:tetratricopeptide repeat protein [Bacteroidales bacterium]
FCYLCIDRPEHNILRENGVIGRRFACILALIFAMTVDQPFADSQSLHENDSLRVDSMIRQSAAIMSHNPDQALTLARLAFELSSKVNDSLGMAQAIFQIGEGYRIKGENMMAFNQLMKALEIYRKLSHREGEGQCLNGIGRIYRFLGNYDKALEYHLNALDVFESTGNKKGISAAMVNAGVVYRNLHQEEKAKEFYRQALDIASEIGDDDLIVNALVSIGNLSWYSGNNRDALENYEKALEIATRDGFQGDNPAGIINNIGNVYREMGEFEKAISYYFWSLEVSEKVGDKNQIAVTFKNIGIAYEKSGRLDQAASYLERSMRIAKDIRLFRVLSEVYQHLSSLYAARDDYRRALDYYRYYTSLNDSLMDEETRNKLAQLQMDYEFVEKNRENILLQQSLEIAQIKSAKERNLRNYLVVISLLVVLLTAIILNRYFIKKKANQELRKLNYELEKRVGERTRKLREENLKRQKAQEQAEMANETKTRFFATVSHEVRTPINAIIGFCDLTMQSGLNEQQKDNLRKVKDASQHLLSLFKDILDYSQIESGQLELKNDSFDLEETLHTVINAFYLDARSKGIRLQLEVDSHIPHYLIGDDEVLRQILFNLTANALKFTEEGRVSLHVSIDNEDLANDQIRLLFRVEDTGVGLSEMKRKLLMKDFTGEPSLTNRKHGVGVGLGLTISRYLVHRLGGDMWVESEKGKGSIFFFTINLKVDTAKAVRTGLKKPPERKPLHILVAEDNLLNAQVVMAFLKRLGHSSRMAENGKVVIDMLSRDYYDAVLMDIEMPEMDGLEATEAIRRGEGQVLNPEIPVIALTAHALKDYERRSMNAGMNHYLTKPVDIRKLSEVLETVIGWS